MFSSYILDTDTKPCTFIKSIAKLKLAPYPFNFGFNFYNYLLDKQSIKSSALYLSGY